MMPSLVPPSGLKFIALNHQNAVLFIFCCFINIIYKSLKVFLFSRLGFQPKDGENI